MTVLKPHRDKRWYFKQFLLSVQSNSALGAAIITIIGGGQDGAVSSNAPTINELTVSQTQRIGN